MEKRYIKGFELNIHKCAELIGEVDSVADPMAITAVRVVVGDFNREAYKYIGLGRTGPKDQCALVVVLQVGKDHNELESRDLGPIDQSIQEGLPYVLEGPYVWEEMR